MQILWDEHVDLLIVDIFMPRVNGLDVIRRLKKEKVRDQDGRHLRRWDDCRAKSARAAAAAGAVRELLPS